MDFKEYFEQTSTTAVYKPEFASGYCYLGLIGEIVEFHDLMAKHDYLILHTDAVKELGDITWYIIEISKSFHMSVELAQRCFEDGMLMYTTKHTYRLEDIMRFANTLKRRYKKTDVGNHDKESEQHFIVLCWNLIFASLTRINHVFNSDCSIDYVFEKNILKLRARYNETKTEGLAN